MKYRVSVKLLLDGQFYARCETGPLGLVDRVGRTEAEALERVQREIEYQLEWCPCTGAAREEVVLERIWPGSA